MGATCLLSPLGKQLSDRGTFDLLLSDVARQDFTEFLWLAWYHGR